MTAQPGAETSPTVFPYLVMRLAEEKIIDLDRPLYEYLSRPLSEYRAYAALAGDDRYKRITGRMAVNHSTGLPGSRHLTAQNRMTFLFPPGTKHSYSSVGIAFLQMTLEEITGKDLETLTSERVFPSKRKDRAMTLPGPVRRFVARRRMSRGVNPISPVFGLDRGLPFHRHYLERFFSQHRADIRGTVLEFQDPVYAPRFAPGPFDRLDILHVDDSNPLATLVGDITRRNSLPSDRFDCIICTHVLHLVGELEYAVRETHRILSPGGVLLVGVPGICMAEGGASDYWRFTPGGLRWLLARVFGDAAVDVRGYGNSLSAAAELRGLLPVEFTPAEVEYSDPRFALEVCARAVKVAS